MRCPKCGGEIYWHVFTQRYICPKCGKVKWAEPSEEYGYLSSDKYLRNRLIIGMPDEPPLLTGADWAKNVCPKRC